MKSLLQKLNPTSQKELNIVIYQSLQELKILLFWEILKEKNPLLLDPKYTADKKYTEEEKEYIQDTWTRLYDEVYTHKNAGRSKVFLSKKYKEMVFSAKIKQIETITHSIHYLILNEHHLPKETYTNFLDKFYNQLNRVEKKLKLSINKSIEENLQRITKIHKALTDKYKTSFKSDKEDVQKEISNIFKVVARVEDIIGRSLPNIEQMSVLQWLSYEELAKEKLDGNGKKLHKRTRNSRKTN